MRWIVADCETSGLGDDAGVCEIAWCEVDEQLNVLASHHSLINPGHPISPSASGVHGITDSDVADSPTLRQFVGDHFSDGEIILVAYNAQFDERFLKPVMPAMISRLCALKMARLIYPDAPDHKLQTMRYYLALDSGAAHSADGDVTVLLSLMRRMSEDSNMTLPELWELSKRPIRIDKMPFGRHKGSLLKDLPGSYVVWLLGLHDLDDNLRFSLETL